MKVHKKINIILLGLLIIVVLIYCMKLQTIKEGSLSGNARTLSRWLDRGKNAVRTAM
jgi:hypothetical protein